MKSTSRQLPHGGESQEQSDSVRAETSNIEEEKAGTDAPTGFRILIVDRDSMSSHLLATALSRQTGLQAFAVDAADLLRHLRSRHSDMVVIGAGADQTSPSDFELVRAVRQSHPSVLIATLLSHPTRDSVLNAFRSGARGIFPRQQPMTDFLTCVEHVRKGLIWAPERETNFLLDAIRSFPSPNVSRLNDLQTLTYREKQVVHAAAKGKTNKTIASDLKLSENTVKNYLFRAFQKLGVTSRVELFLYLTQVGQCPGVTHPEKDDSGSSGQKTSS